MPASGRGTLPREVKKNVSYNKVKSSSKQSGKKIDLDNTKETVTNPDVVSVVTTSISSYN